jgi:hypothetical protein
MQQSHPSESPLFLQTISTGQRPVEKSVALLAGKVLHLATLVAAISTRSSAHEAAREFLTFLARPSFRAKFAEGGLDFRQE